MNTYVVITQMIDNGEVLPAGSLIREDRFTADRIALQLSLGLIAPVSAPQPEPDASASAAPVKASKSPAAAKE